MDRFSDISGSVLVSKLAGLLLGEADPLFRAMIVADNWDCDHNNIVAKYQAAMARKREMNIQAFLEVCMGLNQREAEMQAGSILEAEHLTEDIRHWTRKLAI